MGTTARRVDRPTRCRAIPTRAPCPVAPLRGHALHMAGRSEVLAPHFSPAVPPGSSTAHRAQRRPVAVLAGEPGAWYRHTEPLLLARLCVGVETVAHGGLRGSLYHSLRPFRDSRHPPPQRLVPRHPAPQHADCTRPASTAGSNLTGPCGRSCGRRPHGFLVVYLNELARQPWLANGDHRH